MSLLLTERYDLRPTENMLKEMREADHEGRPVVVVGIIQKADWKNQNNRIYPKSILKKEVDRYKSEVIANGTGLGELDHCDVPLIQLERVSHVIDDIWWDGDKEDEVWGKIRLLPTPRGDIAKKIVLQGVPLGISSRAVGTVTSKNDGDYVNEDLNMICWDLVGTPSVNSAYLRIHESKQVKNFDPRKVYPAKYRIKDTLRDLLDK